MICIKNVGVDADVYANGIGAYAKGRSRRWVRGETGKQSAFRRTSGDFPWFSEAHQGP
jgi:hypothetical protein